MDTFLELFDQTNHFMIKMIKKFNSLHHVIIWIICSFVKLIETFEKFLFRLFVLFIDAFLYYCEVFYQTLENVAKIINCQKILLTKIHYFLLKILFYLQFKLITFLTISHLNTGYRKILIPFFNHFRRVTMVHLKSKMFIVVYENAL